MEYNLSACLQNNSVGFSAEDIKTVHAVFEGERDGPDWAWVVTLNNDTIYYIQGGCDYTGWDCQSHASATQCDRVTDAAALGYSPEVIRSLSDQVYTTKAETWREKKDKELGVVSGVPLESF